jgi:hypothetical protein
MHDKPLLMFHSFLSLEEGTLESTFLGTLTTTPENDSAKFGYKKSQQNFRLAFHQGNGK